MIPCDTPQVDEVAEAFWNRYAQGRQDYRPPVVDNAAGQVIAYKYLNEVSDSEAAFLAEIANVRFS